MNQYAMKSMKQIELFEGGIEMKKQPAKRVNIVSLRMVKESCFILRCGRSRRTMERKWTVFIPTYFDNYLVVTQIFDNFLPHSLFNGDKDLVYVGYITYNSIVFQMFRDKATAILKLR